MKNKLQEPEVVSLLKELNRVGPGYIEYEMPLLLHCLSKEKNPFILTEYPTFNALIVDPTIWSELQTIALIADVDYAMCTDAHCLCYFSKSGYENPFVTLINWNGEHKTTMYILLKLIEVVFPDQPIKQVKHND